jgi:uncharacterized YccA/Bax inhibitor family protein
MASFFERFTRSSNPVMNEQLLVREANAQVGTIERTFTLQSAINKTFVLLALLMFTAVIGYNTPSPVLVWGGAIGALIVVIVSAFKKQWSPVLAPVYALLEGFFVGGVSAMYASFAGGIVLQAISLTLLVFFVMLVIYKTRIIPITNKFRVGLVMATGAIFLIYLLSFILSFFGINMPYVHEGGPWGILFSIAVLGIASLNLLLDFDMFERGEEHRAPSYMEWFAGMGLLITIVWIYIEFLRLLAKLRE